MSVQQRTEEATVDPGASPSPLVSVGNDSKHHRAALGIHALLSRATGTVLPARLWDGTELGDPDSRYRLVINSPAALRSLLLPPSDRAAGEAYVRGDVDIEGDVVEALAAIGNLGDVDIPATDRVRLAKALLQLPPPGRDGHGRRAQLRGRRHSKARDRAAVAFHYDLPQSFYAAFLDPDLVYSCAYFDDPEEGLAAAQTRKLDLVCRKLRLRPGMRLLDVGCGYGSLLVHAAKHYGVKGVGVTLSETQVEVGRERLAAMGLDHQVELRLTDYRDIDETFDAVASIGMVEHVGPSNHPAYFEKLRQALAPGGLLMCHGIVRAAPRRLRGSFDRSFIGTHVFPDGGLVPAWRTVREVERAGFALLDVEQLRPNYALTLRAWVANLEANRDQAVAAGGEEAYRTWRAYMAGSAAAFEAGRLGVVQVLAGREARVPLGRAWMLPRLPAVPRAVPAA